MPNLDVGPVERMVRDAWSALPVPSAYEVIMSLPEGQIEVPAETLKTLRFEDKDYARDFLGKRYDEVTTDALMHNWASDPLLFMSNTAWKYYIAGKALCLIMGVRYKWDREEFLLAFFQLANSLSHFVNLWGSSADNLSDSQWEAMARVIDLFQSHCVEFRENGVHIPQQDIMSATELSDNIAKILGSGGDENIAAHNA
jgi:hypothetical protein